jgi:Sec-independent protein secretion pathway component TatC
MRTIFWIIIFIILAIIITPSNGGLIQFIKAISLLIIILILCLFARVFTNDDVYINDW